MKKPVYFHTSQDCIPQYVVGHEARLNEMFADVRRHSLPLSLLGASYRGVSVNDCIYNAKREVERVMESQR